MVRGRSRLSRPLVPTELLIQTESQMLGFRFSSASRIACAALAVTILSAPASFAASVQHNPQVREVPRVTVYPHARAQYDSGFPNTVDRSNECIGGYRWMRHQYNWDHTAAQDEVPLPCR